MSKLLKKKDKDIMNSIVNELDGIAWNCEQDRKSFIKIRKEMKYQKDINEIGKLQEKVIELRNRTLKLRNRIKET